MALRNQPYLPLYVQDYLTDEKLNLCSLSSQGVYIKLMCIMHKSEEYGVLLLKQKDKQNESICLNFASKIARLIPIDKDDLNAAISELVEEKVLIIDGDKLIQKRMVADNLLSEKRAEAGSKGGRVTQEFAKAKAQANSENENENENVIKDKGKKSAEKKTIKGNCLMKNSGITVEMVREAFRETADLKTADPQFYYDSAFDWSKNGNMRVDWIATVRNFARRDLRDGKLRITKPKERTTLEGAPDDFGEISPSAITREQYLKEKEQKKQEVTP